MSFFPRAVSAWFAAFVPWMVYGACFEFEQDNGKALFYFAEHEVEKGDPEAECALIWIHGMNGGSSDAARVLRKKLAASAEGRKVYCIAPSFNTSAALKNPDMREQTLLWDKDNWRGGGRASNGEAGSFELVDRLCQKLVDRAKYPRLRRIVIAGFSAGGQFVGRYVAVGRPPQAEGVRYSFVAGGPSSYLYIDKRRMQDGKFAVPAAPDPKFNDWRYGLDRRGGYAGQLSPEEIMANLTSRPVLYLCGEADTDTKGKSLDKSPAAMLEGKNRYERFQIFQKYTELFPEWRKMLRFVSVPGAGHDRRRVVFERPEFLALVLGAEDAPEGAGTP